MHSVRGATIGVVAAVLAVAAAGAGTAAVAQDGPTLEVGDGEVPVGGETTVTVTLTEAPNGLAGYNLSVAVGPNATIVGGSVNDEMLLTNVRVVDDRRIYLRGIDLNDTVGNGTGAVTLGTVTVRGDTESVVSLEASTVELDNDVGESAARSVWNGSLVVGNPTAGGSAGGSADGTESANGSGSPGGSGTPGLVATMAIATVLLGVVVLAGVGLREIL
jgi:hypothetical protein